jgi:integrase
MRRRKEVGIRPKRGKWQAYVDVIVDGKPKQITNTYEFDTPRETMRAWRDTIIAEYLGERPAPPAGSFAAKVAQYLADPKVKAMPSFDEREHHLELWLAELGRDRAIASITKDPIEAVLQRWLKRYSPVTVYHRRTALRTLFVWLFPNNKNPVDGTTVPDHYRPTDRSQPFELLKRIVAAMPTYRYFRKGLRQLSIAKLAAEVILHTGIPPAELLKLRAHHFHPHTATVDMPWRDKGEGRAAYTLELSADGVAALIAFDAAGAWDNFSESAVSHSYKRAARRVCGQATSIRLYDERHGLGADVYRTTRDLATVGRLLGHAEGSVVTARYAMGAHKDVDRAAVAAVAAARTGQMAALNLPAKPARASKPRKQNKLRRVG